MTGGVITDDNSVYLIDVLLQNDKTQEATPDPYEVTRNGIYDKNKLDSNLQRHPHSPTKLAH